MPWPITQVVYDKDVERASEKMLEEEAEPQKASEPQTVSTVQTTSTTVLTPAPVVQEVMGEEMLKPLDEKRA